jgi:hypothetical protein
MIDGCIPKKAYNKECLERKRRDSTHTRAPRLSGYKIRYLEKRLFLLKSTFKKRGVFLNKNITERGRAMSRFLICNLFHKHMWRDVRETERNGLPAKKAIHCEICDGPIADIDEHIG